MRVTSRSGSHLMVFLSALVATGTLISYRSLLSSYDVASTLEISASPPPKKNREDPELSSQTSADNSNIIWIRDFVPLPPPPQVLAESKPRASQIDFESIAKNWELPDGSIELLKEIQLRTLGFDYNETTDILALRHPLKTGGTSFSHMLKKIFGKERVLPGSAPSGWWNQEKFDGAVEKHPDQDDPYWSNIAAMYTHTLLRPIGNGKDLLARLRRKVPALNKKRFRLMTNVRRPLDLAASSFYETRCRVGRFANQVRLNGKECPPVNLTDVMYKNIEHWTKKCKTEHNWGTTKCQILKDGGGESLYKHCGSIDVLLDETKIVHNMLFKNLMGSFPRPLDGQQNRTGINLTPTLEDVSLYTLRDLGGLIDYHPEHKEDFVWFAITERFSESMCLFYYHFEIPPTKEKKALMKPCRPLAFWTEEQKQRFIDKEDFSYTVWRAANAIMDVRLENMRLQIKGRLDAGEKLEDMPYVGPGCYVPS